MMSSRAEEFDCKIALIPIESFPTNKVVRGRVDRFEKKRMLLVCDQSLKVSQAITVEHEDTLILGEVLACAPGTGNTWACFIKVEQVLTALQSLLGLREQLLGAEGATRRTLREVLVLAA